jgi:hypothetical protein
MTIAQRAFKFYKSLEFRYSLPRGVEVMNPYRNSDVRNYTKSFLFKFFSDKRKRILVFGINPGRFGEGVTGVTFTDPIALEKFCGIANSLPKKRELSSEFIYKFIKQWGGPKKFYRNFFLTAISPLGFLKDGKNYNFYDHPDLLRSTKPFIVKSIKSQLAFGASREAAIVLGTGKIRKVLSELNEEYKFFKNIYSVEHPRFIMQYRRKKLEIYLQKYRQIFSKVLKRVKKN